MEQTTWYKGLVIKVEDETNDARRFWVQLPDLGTFNFLPGQYVTVDLPIHETADKRHKHYSIASYPDGTNIFELLVVLNKKGIGTQYLFENIKTGSELSVKGPLGACILQEPLDKDIFLVCTGSGIAPFRSMLQHIHHKQIAHKNIYLIVGSRTKDDLIYYEEMIKLQTLVPGFQYIPTLSRQEWEGNMGYVHLIYENLCRNRTPANFFLSGCRQMVEEAKEKISLMGYDKIIVH
jgi:CDP-4-dehydro-6-deoxyglucose reductase